jgi:hypothetical protein
MKGIFSNFRINKKVDRTGVNSLIRNVKRRTKTTSIIVFSVIDNNGERINENWHLSKKRNGKYEFVSHDEKSDFSKISKDFKTSLLNYLTISHSIIVILICNMNQKIDKNKTIKEMWGFKIEKEKDKTSLSSITSEEIYGYSTTNAYTGKFIPPKKELVYCGPDGKICGWDMI